jgi:LysM repeat protein
LHGKNVIIFATVNKMKKSIAVIFLVFVLVVCSAYLLSGTAQASNGFPQAQYQTPTPDANGRIVYIVEANDTCIRISLLTKVSVATIQALNNLDANCSIFSGQQLLLAVVTATPMLPTSEFTETPAGPTPTPFHGNGQICIVLFDDADGNGRKGDAEAIIPDGNISISDRTGAVSLTGKTLAGTDPVCFIDIPEGDYNISIAVPAGYNPTTSLNYPLTLKAGDMATVGFGAQSKNTETTPPTTSILLGVIGIILVLGGIGIGIYIWRSGMFR